MATGNTPGAKPRDTVKPSPSLQPGQRTIKDLFRKQVSKQQSSPQPASKLPSIAIPKKRRPQLHPVSANKQEMRSVSGSKQDMLEAGLQSDAMEEEAPSSDPIIASSPKMTQVDVVSPRSTQISSSQVAQDLDDGTALTDLSSNTSDDDELALAPARTSKRSISQARADTDYRFSSEEEEEAKTPKMRSKRIDATSRSARRKAGNDRSSTFSLEAMLKERQERLQELAVLDKIESDTAKVPQRTAAILHQVADEESAKRLETLLTTPKVASGPDAGADRHQSFFIGPGWTTDTSALLASIDAWRDQMPEALSLISNQDVYRFATSSALAVYMQLKESDMPSELTKLLLFVLCSTSDECLMVTLQNNIRMLLRGETLGGQDIREAMISMGGRNALAKCMQQAEQSFSWTRVRQLSSLLQLASQRPVESDALLALLPITLDEEYAHCLTREIETLLGCFFADKQRLDVDRIARICSTVPLQATLLDALPTSSPHACAEVQRLACAFLLPNSQAESPEGLLKDLTAMLMQQEPFHPINAKTDYTALSAALDVLSHALVHLEDPYKSAPEGGSVSAVVVSLGGYTSHLSPYMAQLANLCESLQRKHARIVDSKASLVYRSEAKSKIQRLSARLRFQLEMMAASSESGYERI